MGTMKRITIYVDHVDSSADFDRVEAWLKKWKNRIIVADYSTGGWGHCWDIEAPSEAVT